MTSALDSEPAHNGDGARDSTGAKILIPTTKRMSKRMSKRMRKRIRLSQMMKKRTTLPCLPCLPSLPSQTCA